MSLMQSRPEHPSGEVTNPNATPKVVFFFFFFINLKLGHPLCFPGGLFSNLLFLPILKCRAISQPAWLQQQVHLVLSILQMVSLVMDVIISPTVTYP